MSEIDQIKVDIADTKAKLKQAEEAKDFVRRDRLEGLLIEQLKLVTQGEFHLLGRLTKTHGGTYTVSLSFRVFEFILYDLMWIICVDYLHLIVL